MPVGNSELWRGSKVLTTAGFVDNLYGTGLKFKKKKDILGNDSNFVWAGCVVLWLGTHLACTRPGCNP